MAVRLKFQLQRYQSTLAWNDRTKELRTLYFTPVTGGSNENKEYYDATPSGEFQFGTINRAAWEQFQIGKSYYFTVESAED
jgi:hypothetical protein